ncbi:hypothetical protein [Phenylobacterium sp.]|uniref:hypothetical protein n=1 Tax=Phenylobacterium sp. TaxID=1871053 RepID=UPI00301D1400
MAFDPAKPRHALPLAGETYELIGSFELIEAVEYAMKEGVGKIAVSVVDGMPSHDLARLLSAIMTASGHKLSQKEAADILWNDVGLSGDENNLLRLHLYSFLKICLSRPADREATAKEMGEMLGELKALAASPGKTTSDSA